MDESTSTSIVPHPQLQDMDLVAVLYSMAYLKQKIQSAELFYEDKRGPKKSIASRHGPENPIT